MARAIGLKSTPQDLLSFIEATLGYQKTPLAASMAIMLSMRRPTRYAGLEMGLGGIISPPARPNRLGQRRDWRISSPLWGFHRTARSES